MRLVWPHNLLSGGASRLVLLAALIAPHEARSEEWRWVSDDVGARANSLLRFSTRAALWISEFERPSRACDETMIPRAVVEVDGSLRVSQQNLTGKQVPPSFVGFCNPSSSGEIGIGAGMEVAFRVLTPIYITVGFDIVYSAPYENALKNQVIVPVPFGVLLTPYAWTFRPIVHATITPVLFLTDDARDYTLGGDLGFAWRVLNWGDLSLTLGYRSAETISSWQVQIGLHPVP